MPVSVGEWEKKPPPKRKWGQVGLAGGIFALIVVVATTQMQENSEKNNRAEALKEAVIFTYSTYQAEFTNDPNKPKFLRVMHAYGEVEVSLEADGEYEQLISRLPSERKMIHAQAWCRAEVTEKIAPTEVVISLLTESGGVLATGKCR